MTESFREMECSPSSRLQSISPHISSNGTRSPRRKSKSPQPPDNSTERCGNCSPQTNVIRDSRPDIIAWPTPPNAQSTNNNNQGNGSEESTKLFSILKVASSTAPRGRESELKKKIQTLEDTVAEYERQKYNVMGTFSEYRERVAERERKLEAEYSSRIIALSEEVLGAKKDFEARMKSFQALQDKFEREKEQALEKLRQEHQKEIQLLEQRFSESQLLNLEQKYMIEIQRLEEERKSLKAEKERLGETFEMKLRRAQSLYETELTAAKMLYSKELEALRDHEEALKEELLARQDEFHDRLQELQDQTKRSREELATCKNEVTALEKRLLVKEAEVVAISKELEEARNETNDSLRKLSQVENELQEAKQQYRQQEEELQRKSNLLNIVETAKSKLEAFIRDLQAEVKALKNKVEFLEKERENLQSQSESQTKLQNSQVNALEAVLESVTKEKESTKDHYESLLERERQQAEEREYAMKKEFSSKLNELESQYNSLKDHLEHSTKRNVEQEILDVKEENRALLTKVDTLKYKLDLLLESNDDSDSGTIRKIKQLIDESDQMKDEVEKYKELLNKKELEIKKLEQFERQRTAVDEMSVIKDEIGFQLMNSDGHLKRDEEVKKLKTEIAELLAEREDVVILNENLLKLKSENEKLINQLRYLNVQDSSDIRDSGQMRSDVEQRMTDEISQKWESTEISEISERRLREEFQAQLEERVEEETLKVTSRYEMEINEAKNTANEKNKELEANMNILKNDCSQKTKQITELSDKNKKLMDEISAIHNELEKKNQEIKNFSKKTDEYLRKRENQQAQILEKKIVNLNKEHEKTIEMMKKHEIELVNKYQKLQQQLTNKPETGTHGIQTNIEDENEAGTSEINPELNEQIQQLQKALGEKDALISQLQKALEILQESEIEDKKNRSNSFTAGEASKNQTITSNLQILLTETQRQAKSNSKSGKQELTKSKKRKEKESSEKDKVNHCATGIPRPKSPSYSGRLYERSLTKSKSPTVDVIKQKEDKRSLLSPDFERSSLTEEHRRSSPGRQPSLRPKKEATSSSVGSSNSSGNKDDLKRPAWKF
ncbi:Trichohyalin, putative [Brugia malayi]|uniref:BMA-TAG-278, isoform d n=1 Tax=Brugia malayi TaxID=6279 RepID=A0A1P6BT71_BRUMA|nr:Trichohyalin, putative [Brugia malayi]CDP97052.1 BMA-TAG-278, isoform d [Brugia malayi]VIO85852.1 Trichohyalin, putative [Brugia malayi]